MKPVIILPPEVARKIAAGEVIDRPNAVIRELLDNAVDSGADSITAEIDGGGIDKIRIIDNGFGMTKNDLENCARPHATSKITSEADLLTLSTLGFRGEALASIAAVSRLDITTCDSDSQHAWHLETSITENHNIKPANLARGTIVQSCGLFENFPARRQFLKRPAAEGTLCRQVFIEKSLPRPDISFRLVMDGKIKLDLPKETNLTSRVVKALSLPEDEKLFFELKDASSADWEFSLIIGEPAVYRADRKNIHIFVNGRKIQEYSLMQAIEYGSEGYFPNGTHPVACLFLKVNSALVDFNIHPAKREARFKDIAPIHRAISMAVKTFFKTNTLSTVSKQIEEKQDTSLFSTDEKLSESSVFFTKDNFLKNNSAGNNYPTNNYSKNNGTTNNHLTSNYTNKSFYSNTTPTDTSKRDTFFRDSFSVPSKSFEESNNKIDNELVSDVESTYQKKYTNNFRFLGSTLGTFLLAEFHNQLFVIDQHAAHERILFDKFLKTAGQKQPLMIPYIIETTSADDDKYLESITTELDDAGFEIHFCDEGTWEITAVPICWQGTEKDLYKDLLEIKREPSEIIRKIAASASCRAAVMDGTILDDETAAKIVDGAFSLEDPHCPHGRPVWTVLNREELFARVKRT